LTLIVYGVTFLPIAHSGSASDVNIATIDAFLIKKNRLHCSSWPTKTNSTHFL